MSGEIRRVPGADGMVPAGLGRDEQSPLGRGVFRRVAASQGSVLSGMAGIIETVFAPGTEPARQEIQRQRHVGQGTPAPTDPPDDEPVVEENRVAAPGRRGTPFSGYIVLRWP